MSDSTTVPVPATSAPVNAKAQIEKLIADAKARTGRLSDGASVAQVVAEANEATKRADAERIAAQEARKAARDLKRAANAEKSVERDEKRKAKKALSAQKKLDKEAKRVEKQAQKAKKNLTLSADAEAAFDALGTLSLSDLAAVHVMLGKMIKEKSVAVAKADNADLAEAGDRVVVIGGEHIGETGTITEARRVRCFVKVDGSDKSLYLYRAHVKALPVSDTKAE